MVSIKMLTDFYGNKLTTTTGLARDNYDVGLKAFLSANYGAQEAFSLAVEADPGFSLAYAGLARAYMSAGNLDKANQSLNMAKQMLNETTDREKSHVLCAELLISGKSKEAKDAVAKHLDTWPRDALVAQMSMCFWPHWFFWMLGTRTRLTRFYWKAFPLW